MTIALCPTIDAEHDVRELPTMTPAPIPPTGVTAWAVAARPGRTRSAR